MIQLSVIIPVYKTEKTICECVDSVLREIPENSEIILVDDGSPDLCPRICDEYAKQDMRIRVLHQENGGLSTARNAGLEIAKGKYVFFIDSDDYIEKDYFTFLLKHDSDLVISNFIAFYQDGAPDFTIPINEDEYEDVQQFLKKFELYFGTLFNFAWGKLYRRDIIEKYCLRFQNGVSMVEDVLFNVSYYRVIKTISIEKDAILRYRQISGTLSKSFQKETFAWYILSYSEVKKLLEDAKIFQDVYDAYRNRLMGNVFECIQGSIALDKKQRKQLLFDICEEQEVQKCLRNYRATSFRMKGVCFGIGVKSPKLLMTHIRIYRCMAKTKHRIMYLFGGKKYELKNKSDKSQ